MGISLDRIYDGERDPLQELSYGVEREQNEVKKETRP